MLLKEVYMQIWFSGEQLAGMAAALPRRPHQLAPQGTQRWLWGQAADLPAPAAPLGCWLLSALVSA